MKTWKEGAIDIKKALAEASRKSTQLLTNLQEAQRIVDDKDATLEVSRQKRCIFTVKRSIS